MVLCHNLSMIRNNKDARSRGEWQIINPAWLAGFLDGEGSITYSNSTCPTIQITCANTDRSVIVFLAEETGLGSVYEMTSKRTRCKKAWHWKVSAAHEIKTLLDRVRPHLRVKQKQADVALELVSIMLANRRTYHSTPIERNRRIELMNELRRLNRKGITDE